MNKKLIYLNNSATSYPKPDKVIESVKNYIVSPPFNLDRVGVKHRKKDVIKECRIKLAALFNINNYNNVFFSSGSTESLNLALNGILKEDDHIVTTVTEHNSVIRPLKHLEKKRNIKTCFTECDKTGFVDPDDIKRNITKKTKAVVVNHCSNVTGAIQDVKTIAKITHENNCVFILDASQSAGATNIDVENMGIDILIFTGHKSLFGLQGIGGLYIKDGIDVEPLIVGGTGSRSDLLEQPKDRPIYYEAGTQNITGIVSLEAGVSYILGKGVNNIVKEKSNLAKSIFDFFNSDPKITLYSKPLLKNDYNPVISFNIKSYEPDDLSFILFNSYNVVLRSGLHCAPLIHKYIDSFPLGTVRASLTCLNTPDEIEFFINSIKEICDSC